MALYMAAREDEDGTFMDDPEFADSIEDAWAVAKRRWPDASSDEIVVYRCSPI